MHNVNNILYTCIAHSGRPQLFSKDNTYAASRWKMKFCLTGLKDISDSDTNLFILTSRISCDNHCGTTFCGGEEVDFYEYDQSRASRRRERASLSTKYQKAGHGADETLSVSRTISGQRSIPLISPAPRPMSLPRFSLASDRCGVRAYRLKRISTVSSVLHELFQFYLHGAISATRTPPTLQRTINRGARDGEGRGKGGKDGTCICINVSVSFEKRKEIS